MLQILSATANQFNGIEIDTPELPDDPVEFSERLDLSLAAWRRQGFQVMWLNLPTALAQLIPAALAAGCRMHHVGEEEGKRDYLLLYLQLQEGAFVPPYATHYIGAGGVIVNIRRELLVVSEKYRRDMSRPYWKPPGGALNPQEHLVDGVIREVYEETGVRAEFEALVSFRHWHGYRYNKSDIYFVCRLRPLSEEISIDETEIDQCQWMPVEEYLSSEYVGTFNRQIVRAALESPGIGLSWVDGYDNPRTHEFFFPPLDT